MKTVKRSRCGFVVVKLKIDESDYFLMRGDPSWKDVNFIGGHERPRDRGRLKNAARRESLEEVPALRGVKAVELEPLTDEMTYGPVYSPSSGREVEYEVRFFLLKFHESPEAVVRAIGPRSLNVLVRQDDLLAGDRRKVSELARVLDRSFPGGLRAVPYSWPRDLKSRVGRDSAAERRQTELMLE